MDHPVDPVTEADLQAYVEGQLPVARRIEVEAHLCHDRADALRVMEDLRVRDELRLALADMPRMARVSTTDAARRLERGLTRGSLFRRFRQVAAVTVLIGAGWLAHAQLGPMVVSKVVASAMPPAYVTDAVRSYRTKLVRAAMHSQPEVPDYDPAEIRAATAIEQAVNFFHEVSQGSQSRQAPRDVSQRATLHRSQIVLDKEMTMLEQVAVFPL